MPVTARLRLPLAALVAVAVLAVPAAAVGAQTKAASDSGTTTTAPPPDDQRPDDSVDAPPEPVDPNTPPPAPVADSGPPPASNSAEINAQAKLDYSRFSDAAQQVQERAAAAQAAAERYEQLKGKKDTLDRDIADIARQVGLQQRGIDALRATVRSRAAVLYVESGHLADTDNPDPNDALAGMRAHKLADTIAEHDRNRTNDLQRRVDRLTRVQTALKRKEAEADTAAEEAKKAKDEVDVTLAISQLYFEQVKAELHIVSSDGKVCPIAGPVTFTNDWGMPRSGGRSHKGTDMINPYGTPNIAVVSGRITFDVSGLGGNGVHLWGDDGNLYYYAHLSRWEGQPRPVKQGEVVGYTGDSGNARGGIAHTHFQMHPGGKEPTNPYPTFAPVCLGLTGAEGPDPNYRPPNS